MCIYSTTRRAVASISINNPCVIKMRWTWCKKYHIEMSEHQTIACIFTSSSPRAHEMNSPRRRDVADVTCVFLVLTHTHACMYRTNRRRTSRTLLEISKHLVGTCVPYTRVWLTRHRWCLRSWGLSFVCVYTASSAKSSGHVFSVAPIVQVDGTLFVTLRSRL